MPTSEQHVFRKYLGRATLVFNASRPSRDCLFENVSVIPLTRLSFCSNAARTFVRRSENHVFQKYLQRATPFSMCSDMFLAVCSSMFVFFPKLAHVCRKASRACVRTSEKHVFQKYLLSPMSFSCVGTCSRLFVRECLCYSSYSRTFAGTHCEHVCEYLKNKYFKNTSRGRCPFHVLECVPSCLFENLCVIPYICVYCFKYCYIATYILLHLRPLIRI